MGDRGYRERAALTATAGATIGEVHRRRHPCPPAPRAWLAATVAVSLVVGAACSDPGESEAVGNGPVLVEPEEVPGGLPGALEGLVPDDHAPDDTALDRLVDQADEVADSSPQAREPLDIDSTEDDFVDDAQRAWTLALASRVTGRGDLLTAAEAMVEDWVTTTRTLENTCPDTGGCDTSLMVSRAAPGFVFAVDVLRDEGAYDAEQTRRFHTWLQDVIVPAASDRENNWGDAGTYLRAVAAVELGDTDGMEEAADLWRERLDQVQPDGQVPEEVRRGEAGLLYSQEALDYKVATADVLGRAGLDLWGYEGADGGSLRGALDLVATALEDPDTWPAPVDDLRVPHASGMWPLAVAQWPDAGFGALAREAAEEDGLGHSAVIWTAVTHPVP